MDESFYAERSVADIVTSGSPAAQYSIGTMTQYGADGPIYPIWSGRINTNIKECEGKR